MNTGFSVKMRHLKVLVLLIACFISSSHTSNRTLFDVKGKVALITGGCGGIGRAYAEELLRNGCEGISLVDKNSTNAAKIKQALETEFDCENCVLYIKADVTDSEALDDAFQKTCDYFNQLDIVINNAGIADEKTQRGKLLLNTDLVAVEYGTRLAFEKYLPYFMGGTEGVVVNTASIVGLIPTPIFPNYSAAKSGVVILGRTMGNPYYYNQNNVRILTLCPGTTNTPLLQALGNLPFEDAITSKIMSKIQEPEAVGKALISILREGETGSVWIINAGNLSKVNFAEMDGFVMNLLNI